MTQGEFFEIPGRPPKAVEYENGFSIDLPLMLSVEDSPRAGYAVEITYERGEHKPIVGAVCVKSMQAGQPVTTSVSREATITEHSRDNLLRQVKLNGRPVAVVLQESLTNLQLQQLTREEYLKLVKDIYQYAELTDQPPAKLVAYYLSLSPATAGRRIRESKDYLRWDDGGEEYFNGTR